MNMIVFFAQESNKGGYFANIMIQQHILLEMLREACRAPSGDNAQPWRFQWDGSTLALYNIPGIHNPHLDFEERGAYIAHGALIENLCIAAPHYGYEVSVVLFPDHGDMDLVARIAFTACEPNDDSLYASLSTRATNHHSYQNRPLTAEEKSAFEKSAMPSPGIELKLVTEREDIETLARAASRVEIVILDDENISSSFFSGMVWTHAEERKKKSGFFVKTLEFNPIQSFVFWLASKPKILRLFRLIGLPSFIADQDAKLYATGSVAGGVLVADESAEQFISAGRVLERVWLTATKLGFAFQPLVAMVFVAYRVETGRGRLSPAHAKEMNEAFAQTRKVLGGEGKIPVLLFHAGIAPAPSTRTSRR